MFAPAAERLLVPAYTARAQAVAGPPPGLAASEAHVASWTALESNETSE
jgi:hypothetical protein